MNSRRQDKKREIRGRLDRPVGEGLLEAADLWETLWLGEGSHGDVRKRTSHSEFKGGGVAETGRSCL